MWNNARLLNLLANGMFMLAALIIVQIAFVAIINSPWLPLKTVRVLGPVEHVTREHVMDALAGRPLGNFFSADLAAVRGWLETVSWVRQVNVRRQWPDTLEVSFEEHRALARWSALTSAKNSLAVERTLVNTFGELFVHDEAPSAKASLLLAALPRFAGATGTERELTERYHSFKTVLMPLELELTQLALSPRYSWQLRLSDGLVIELGREPSAPSDRVVGRSVDRAVDRLTRFVAAYPDTLATLNRKLGYVDLRYSNGFALRIPELANSAPAPKT